jgi:hypothetical protein
MGIFGTLNHGVHFFCPFKPPSRGSESFKNKLTQNKFSSLTRRSGKANGGEKEGKEFDGSKCQGNHR